MDHNRQDSGATIPAMSAVPHHGNHGRPHSRHAGPRRGKVVTADDDQDEEERLRLYEMLTAKRAARRSAKVSTSLRREDDINSAEKIATRTAGTPATFGGDGVPMDAGSPSEAAHSEPILPTVETEQVLLRGRGQCHDKYS